ncbi:MAG TPA: hypothetical protein VFO06_00625 [Gemmatimonadales bacterium]|nr:hypothetical protein [Gemmatimonadales bacterium]
MIRWAVMFLMSLAACERPQTVTVTAAIPGPDSVDAPLADLAFVALPYDRDSLIAAFEARATTPRPHTEVLDSVFREFRAPFAAYVTVAREAEQWNDSLRALKHRLDSLPRNHPAYTGLFARYAIIRDSLGAIDRRAARARLELERARERFVATSEPLRAAMRAWEDSTYSGYQDAVDSILRAQRRDPVPDTTDARGRALLELPRGRWWLYARSWDADDPNAEWYWNVPITSDTIRLDRRSGQSRPRY